MKPKRIGLLGFDKVTALDLVGPADVFAAAVDLERKAGRAAPYEIVTLGVMGPSFTAGSGIKMQADTTLAAARELDTLIVPGGEGLRVPAVNTRAAIWVKAHAGSIRRVASVCTGIYALAPTGLLDGRRVTTHWEYADAVALKFPRLRVEPNAIFVKDGKFYTSAGVTAGIDLCLALVREDLGPRLALAVARELIVYLVRNGGQEQYSAPLRFQSQATDRFSELAAWMAGHLRDDLSVEALARRASVGPRQFSRRFRHEFGDSPASFVEGLRLDEARRLLSAGGASIEVVAESVGFGSPDSFRRAFDRRFGIPPTMYRGNFSLRQTAS